MSLNVQSDTSESVFPVPDGEWMIRPCEMYREEYSDCTSIKARFHQYFIYGETINCAQWKKDFDNCLKWKENSDTSAAVINNREKAN